MGTGDEAEAIVRARQVMATVKGRARETAGTCLAEIDAYIAARRSAGLSDSTLRSADYVLRAFVAYLDVAHPAQITAAAVQRWFAYRRAEYEHTAVAYLARVKLWTRWLFDRGKLVADPAAEIAKPKLPRRVRRNFLLPDQARLLLDSCQSPGLKFAVYCGLHAGLRKLEIIEARPEWFDLDAGLLHVQATATFQTKDRDNRTIPLTRQFAAWLRDEYGKPAPFMLAPSARHGKWRYRYDFKRAFEGLVKRCGLTCTFHDLRRTFASLHASRGTSIYKVARWLGDAVEVVEAAYGHLIPQDDQINAAWD